VVTIESTIKRTIFLVRSIGRVNYVVVLHRDKIDV